MKKKVLIMPKESLSPLDCFLVSYIHPERFSRIELTISAYNRMLKNEYIHLENEIANESSSVTLKMFTSKEATYNGRYFPPLSYNIRYNGIYLVEWIHTQEREYFFNGNNCKTLVIDY